MVNQMPVCQFAQRELKKNSTRLLIAMCCGIAIAVYGIYVHGRKNSNPTYESTISSATHWLYNNVADRIIHPTNLFNRFVGCNGNTLINNNNHNHKHHYNDRAKLSGKFKTIKVVSYFMMNNLIHPMTHYSGFINLAINLIQIILLKIYCRSKTSTMAIIALSGIGFCVSMLCLIGSISNCKLMCISCLGIPHMFIIYCSLSRLRIIKSMMCPPLTNNNQNNCSYPGINKSNNNNNDNSTGGRKGGGGGGGNSGAGCWSPSTGSTGNKTNTGMVFGNSSSIPRSNTGNTHSSDTPIRRRSNRQ